jgi:cytochrome o ubiquinol oxidase subunit 2
MTKYKNKPHENRPVWLIILGLMGLGLLLAVMLKNTDIALLNPKGQVAGSQHGLMILATAIMLLIAVPTLFLFYFFAWKYRETNTKAKYEPARQHGKLFIFSLWAIPSIIMVVLSVIMWTETHRLEPQQSLASNARPITIQVVAMRWKWLFIYPEQQIATVNFIQLPAGTPVHFELTADEAPMSSFWIPHLGGQLYAMTGHINKLNLIAATPGDYTGSSAEINGAGFAGMKFIARAGTQEEFDAWAGSVHQSFAALDSAAYEKLLVPSENHRYEYFSTPEAGLYDKVVMKYSGSHEHHQTGHEAAQSEGHHTGHQ